MQIIPLRSAFPAATSHPLSDLDALAGRPMSVAEVHTMVARILGVDGTDGLLVSKPARQGTEAKPRQRATLTADLIRTG